MTQGDGNAILGAAIILGCATYWWSTISDDEKKEYKFAFEASLKKLEISGSPLMYVKNCCAYEIIIKDYNGNTVNIPPEGYGKFRPTKKEYYGCVIKIEAGWLSRIVNGNEIVL